jgi:hypothetical protein
MCNRNKAYDFINIQGKLLNLHINYHLDCEILNNTRAAVAVIILSTEKRL